MVAVRPLRKLLAGHERLVDASQCGVVDRHHAGVEAGVVPVVDDHQIALRGKSLVQQGAHVAADHQRQVEVEDAATGRVVRVEQAQLQRRGAHARAAQFLPTAAAPRFHGSMTAVTV